MLQVLLACGADPGCINDEGDMTPLLAAAQYYSQNPELTDVAMLKLKLESRTGADRRVLAMTVNSDEGRSVLAHAAGNAAATAYLLSPGVLDAATVSHLIRSPDQTGKTPADHACKAHNLGSLKLLCNAGALLR